MTLSPLCTQAALWFASRAQRARIAARYDREIAAARARGWTETAEAMERERGEWVADTDATQEQP